ncbi:hypothetical protein FRC16_010361 [Serendipita sp. 398]|nr:hypothetical protein FRC16_010361 [Serendipita sp. 398]
MTNLNALVRFLARETADGYALVAQQSLCLWAGTASDGDASLSLSVIKGAPAVMCSARNSSSRLIGRKRGIKLPPASVSLLPPPCSLAPISFTPCLSYSTGHLITILFVILCVSRRSYRSSHLSRWSREPFPYSERRRSRIISAPCSMRSFKTLMTKYQRGRFSSFLGDSNTLAFIIT